MKIWDFRFRVLDKIQKSLAPRPANRNRKRNTTLAFESLEPRYALAGLAGSVVGVVNGHTYELPDVLISIVGRDQQNAIVASASVRTGADGSYSFAGLPAGTYTITQTQPTGIIDGASAAGSAGGTAGSNTISGIVLGAADNGTGYNFNEKGPSVVSVNMFLSSTPETGQFLSNLTGASASNPPAVAFSSATDPINSSNANNLSASGTGKAGATVSVVVTDGTKTSAARTATVAANGTWSVTGLNANQLANGTVAYEATITDSAGNTATSFLIATKSATDPLVDITSATDPVGIGNQTSVSVSGKAQVGSTVKVEVTDGTTTTTAVNATLAADGTWSVSGINISALKDGTITYRVTMTDSENQSFTDTLTATKATVHITSVTNPVNANTVTNANAQGTGQIGATISVVATDGTTTTAPRTTTVSSDGAWSLSGLDLSGLADGPITYIATATDGAGNTAESRFTATKDTLGPALAIASVTDPIGLSNYFATTVTGTGEAGVAVSLVASDGATTTPPLTTTVQAGGTWQITGLNTGTLKDGTITFTATASDAAGNTTTASQVATKTTVALLSATNPIDTAIANNVSASGTGQVGGTVSVTVSDGTTTSTARTAVVAADGTWAVSGLNVNLLANGTLTYTATISDGLGHTATSTLTATKSATDPLVDISSATDPVNISNQHAVSVSGTAQVGSSLAIVVSDGTTSTSAVTTAPAADGTWSASGIDVSSLRDGSITYTVTMTDNEGHTFTDSLSATKTTVVVTTATNPINLTNVTDGTAQGTGQVGAAISVVASDGTTSTTEYVTTITAAGTWSVSGIDLSGLADGPITYTATATDAFGNTAESHLAAIKDTLAPELTLTFVTDPITLANYFSTTASGTGEVGITVSLVASDGTHGTAAVTTTVTADGTWQISGLSTDALLDGTITYTATAVDAAGNETVSVLTATKATLILDTVSDPIGLDNYTAAAASGTGQVGAEISIVVSDGITQTTAATTIVAGDGAWSVTGIDLSQLRDGTLTFTATANDGSGNTATRTQTAAKATLVLAFVTNPITAANQTAATASGTGQVGASIALTVTDGVTTTDERTTTVAADGTWSITAIDVSGLADGTLTYSTTASDGLGNSATSSLTATKSAVVLLASVTDPITFVNQSSTSASGTGKVGASVSVTATDGVTTTVAATTTVEPDGTWSVTGIDVSGLLDGTITYTATADDGLGNTGVSTLTATKSIPAAPVAEDDTYNVSIGATLTTTTANGVLANDSNAVSATLISGPAHGSVTLNPDGTFSYTQTTYGFDQFVYEVTNGAGQTAQATVTIQVPGLPQLPDGAVLTTTASGLQYYDFVVGTGASPAATDTVTVDYVGYLPTGTVFDSNNNINFSLSGLIVGFSEGVQGMQVGGVRRLIIPPELGYGAGGNPGAGIGGTDTIVFDVTLDAIV